MRKLITLFLLLCCSFAYAIESASFKPYYSNNIDLGFGFAYPNDNFYFGSQLEYTGLVHLSPNAAVGVGTGIHSIINFDFLNDNDDDVFSSSKSLTNYFVPLYAQARFRFLDRKVSPFLNLSLGYNINIGSNSNNLFDDDDNYDDLDVKLKSGFMTNASAGVSIRFKNKMALQAGSFVEYLKTGEEYSNIELNKTINNSLDLFQFGVKVGFSF